MNSGLEAARIHEGLLVNVCTIQGLTPRTPSSAPHGHLPLDDLVRRPAVDHRFAGECLPAARTAEVSLGIVLDDSILEALDQPPRAALPVLVQQLAAVGAIDPDRPCTSSRSHLDRTVTDRVRTAKGAACYAPLLRSGESGDSW